MVIYAAGFGLIYILFFLMYRNAKSHALQIHLTPAELFETNSFMYANLLAISVSIIAAIIALLLPVGTAGNSGFVFFLLGPAYSIWFSYRGKKSRKLFGH
jgi:hypothetical protein